MIEARLLASVDIYQADDGRVYGVVDWACKDIASIAPPSRFYIRVAALTRCAARALFRFTREMVRNGGME